MEKVKGSEYFPNALYMSRVVAGTILQYYSPEMRALPSMPKAWASDGDCRTVRRILQYYPFSLGACVCPVPIGILKGSHPGHQCS